MNARNTMNDSFQLEAIEAELSSKVYEILLRHAAEVGLESDGGQWNGGIDVTDKCMTEFLGPVVQPRAKSNPS